MACPNDCARRGLPGWPGERVLETLPDRGRPQHQHVFDHVLYPDRVPWSARAHWPDHAAHLSLDGVARGFRLRQIRRRFQVRRLLLAFCRRGLGLCSTHCLPPSTSPMTTYHFFTTAWTWNSIVLTLSALAFVSYFFAFGQRGRPLYFVGAIVVFLLALVSPLSALASG